MVAVVKQLMKSKVMIVNVLSVAAGTLTYWQGHEVIAQHPELVSLIVAALGVVNVAARLVSYVPGEDK